MSISQLVATLAARERKTSAPAGFRMIIRSGVTPKASHALMPCALAAGGKVIKCPSLLNVLKDTCDHSCYWSR